MSRTPLPRVLALTFQALVLFAASAAGQAPPNYYATVDSSNPTALRTTLHAVIDDHTRLPYTSGAVDTWNCLEAAMQNPANPAHILDIYRNASFAKQGGGNSFYNREHAWPKSYGFPDDTSSNYPYTDCHLLFLCDDGYNGARSNKPFRFCSAGCTEMPTLANNGEGGGTGTYPGNSNWTSGSFTDGTWEVWMDRRGDIARAMLYAELRYEGGTHGVTGFAEPDLILTDNVTQIEQSNTGSNIAVAYMGLKSVLLTWHQQDPVDAKELTRNDVVFAYQGNRNPFVDHPEWVDCIHGANCNGVDFLPPAAPTALVADAGDAVVDLDWANNAEPDLAGYRVYRSTSGGPFAPVNGALLAASAFSDGSVVNGLTYSFYVTAEDTSGNESTGSVIVPAAPVAAPVGATVWINEFHYDNFGADAGEFVEIAGPAGTILNGWSVVAYDGATGVAYATLPLAGSVPNQQGGLGTRAFAFAALQDGTPDGLALVDGSSAVVEFLAYEGTFVAADGPAQGMTATDIVVFEWFGTPLGNSLQRTGAGNSSADFAWQLDSPNTQGVPNTNQTFAGGATCQIDLGFGVHPTAVFSICGGDLSAGQDATASLSGIPVGAVPLLFGGAASAPTNFFGLQGPLVTVPPLFVIGFPAWTTGSIEFVVPGVGGGPATLYLQFVLQEGAVYRTTNAVRVDVPN